MKLYPHSGFSITFVVLRTPLPLTFVSEMLNVIASGSLLLQGLIFLTINAIQPLVIDTIKYNGGASVSTFLYVFPTYVGMMCVGFLPKKTSIFSVNWRVVLLISLFDIVHQLLEKAGLIYAGASTYIVVGSSSLIWTALLSMVLLNQRINIVQWLAILILTIGLSVRAIGTSEWSLMSDSTELIGCALIALAAIFHATAYIAQELVMTRGAVIIEPCNLVSLMGFFNSVVLLLWTLFYTVPQWDELVLDSISKAHGKWEIVGGGLLTLCVCAFARSAVLSALIKTIGALPVAVLKGLRPVLVTAVSHILFCGVHAENCVTPNKATAAALCSLGVLFYSVGSITFVSARVEEWIKSYEWGRQLLSAVQVPQHSNAPQLKPGSHKEEEVDSKQYLSRKDNILMKSVSQEELERFAFMHQSSENESVASSLSAHATSLQVK